MELGKLPFPQAVPCEQTSDLAAPGMPGGPRDRTQQEGLCPQPLHPRPVRNWLTNQEIHPNSQALPPEQGSALSTLVARSRSPPHPKQAMPALPALAPRIPKASRGILGTGGGLPRLPSRL